MPQGQYLTALHPPDGIMGPSMKAGQQGHYLMARAAPAL